MKNRHEKLEHRFLHRIQMKFNMFCNCPKFAIDLVSKQLYEGNYFKPCLTKLLLNTALV